MDMGLSVSISGYGVYVANEVQADKRSVDDVLLVAHQMVHGFPGGVAAVAEALQMPKGTLTHKLNPTNLTHHLTLREALLMQRATGSTVLLEAEAGFLGQVCQPLVRRLDVLPPSEALTALAMAFAQYLQAMAEPIHRAAAEGAGPLEAVSQAEENRANFHAIGLQEAIADCQASMRALRRAAPVIDGGARHG